MTKTNKVLLGVGMIMAVTGSCYAAGDINNNNLDPLNEQQRVSAEAEIRDDNPVYPNALESNQQDALNAVVSDIAIKLKKEFENKNRGIEIPSDKLELLKGYIKDSNQEGVKEIINDDSVIQEVFFDEVRASHLASVPILIDLGADANMNFKFDFHGVVGVGTPLHYVAGNHSKEMFEILISKGADIKAKDKDGWTPLHYAVENYTSIDEDISKILEISEILISKEADINAKDKYGTTPLHVAAMNTIGDKEISEILISKGADINAKDKYGITPLHCASKEATEILIRNGADINAKDKYGRTPLHCAAEKNSKEVAKILISEGADINAKNRYGRTPLHVVAAYSGKEVAEILLSNGADINVKDNDGKTSLQLAKPASAISELLHAHGAE